MSPDLKRKLDAEWLAWCQHQERIISIFETIEPFIAEAKARLDAEIVNAFFQKESAMNNEQIKMEHNRSQLWAALRPLREDIARLATGGVEVDHEEDLNLIELLALTVQGELDARKAEVEDAD